MTTRKLLRLVLVVPPLAAMACQGSSASGGGSASAPQPTGPVVAHVGNTVITADEVKQKLGEQSPFLQARYRDIEHKKQFVDNLVRFDLLAQEARRRHLDQKPEVADSINKVLVQELIREEFDQKQANFSDADLKDYFDKHVDEFVKPERVRAEQIFIAAPESDRAARAKAKQKLAKALEQLKANDDAAGDTSADHGAFQPQLFADLARQLTEDPATKMTGGDMRYLSKDDMAKQYGEAFADAVFALQKPNDMTSIVEDAKGFRLGRLTNRQLAVNHPFDDPQVKEAIKGRLFRQQKTLAFDKYVDQLKQDAHVTVDEKVLESIEVPGGELPPSEPKLTVPPVPPPGAQPPPKGVVSVIRGSSSARPAMAPPPGVK